MAEGHRVTLLSDPATALASPPAPASAESVARPGAQPRGPSRIPRPADLAMAGAAVWWALPLTHASGGRDAGDEAVLLALLGIAALLVRPWRTLPRTALILPCWVALAALAVLTLSPTGWRGADDAAGYACAALAFVVATGWADSPARRLVLAGALCFATLDQVVGALLPWWARGDPAVLLSGTFYWHNPFAAFLLPGALTGVGLVTWRLRPLHVLGWFTTPLCVAGIVYSSSRATLAMLVLGWAGCGLLAARRSGRARSLTRGAILAGVSLGLTYLLTGPPLFAHRVSPFAGSAERSARGETLASNGGYRAEFWRSALGTFRRHPLVGSGYHGLIESSRPFTPLDYGRSNYAHDGYLQALSDGGLLMGIPVIVASGLLVWLAARSLLGHLRSGEGELLPAVAALALIAAMLHSAVDFDWSHSSVFVLDALVAALLVSGRVRREEAHQRRGVAGLLMLALGLGTVVGALGAHNVPAGARSGEAASTLAARWAAQAAQPLASDAPGRSLLQLAVTTPSAVTQSQRRLALRVTAREATIDLTLATVRAEVALSIGDPEPAATVLSRLRGKQPGLSSYAGDLGVLLAADGQREQGRSVLREAALAALRAHDPIAISGLGVAFAQVEGPASPGAACLRRELVAGGSCTAAELAAA